jgi:DNA-binding MarR family transcriptional regulator
MLRGASGVLAALAEPDDAGRHLATIDDLVALLRCGRGQVIAIVDELESAGMVRRYDDRCYLELTESGLETVSKARAEVAAAKADQVVDAA